MDQCARVLGNGFKISAERAGDFFYRNSTIFFHRPQYGNASVIRRTLEITLQLF